MHARHIIAIVSIMASFGSAYPSALRGMGQFAPFAVAAMHSAVRVGALLPLWRLELPPRNRLRALLDDRGALGLVAISALAYAVATLCARSLRKRSPFTLNGWMALLAIAPLALSSWWLGRGRWAAVRSASVDDWAGLLHAARLVSLIGHVAMFSL